MLSFSSAPGNLFNVLGKIGLVIKNARDCQASQLIALVDEVNGLTAQLEQEADIQAVVGSSYISIENSIGGTVGSLCQQVAADTVNRLVFRDNPRINQNLTSGNTLASLQEVIRQMGVQGATVLAMTVTGTAGSFTGVGNGVMTCSVKRPLDGKTLENSFSESLLFTCTSDSYSDGSNEGNEGFLVTGTGSQPDLFAFDWPLGSNAITGLSAIDGNSDNSAGNLLTNSGFEDFTVNVPDNWSLTVGVGGTNVFEEDSILYDGSHALRIFGAGGTLVSMQQEFDSSSGTAGILSSQSQYSINLWARRDGVAAAAGVLVVEWIDENGTVVNDQAGVANSFSIDLTALTTVYTSYTGVFRTPQVMPDPILIRVRLSTALTNGRSVYLDKMSMGLMTQIGVSSPFVAVHAGSTPFAVNDYGSVVVSNGRGTAGTLNSFQVLFSLLYPSEMFGNELILPSSAVPSISDSLIG